jgi:hypothetical protein
MDGTMVSTSFLARGCLETAMLAAAKPTWKFVRRESLSELANPLPNLM